MFFFLFFSSLVVSEIVFHAFDFEKLLNAIIKEKLNLKREKKLPEKLFLSKLARWREDKKERKSSFEWN
mgnify:CR=1 FL=1